MSSVRDNCGRIFERIEKAAARSGRDGKSIRLIAVTKTVAPEVIRQAVACGITDVGENKFQEGLLKQQALKDLALTWHFIGHLQTNKAKKVTESFDCIHSVDRSELADKLGQYAARPLPILIEVKLHEEPNKSGVAETELAGLVEKASANARLKLRGLMAIPPLFDDPEDARPYFRRLRNLNKQFGLSELSMGMSGDFEVAIEEGATMVRIGTALFGARR